MVLTTRCNNFDRLGAVDFLLTSGGYRGKLAGVERGCAWFPTDVIHICTAFQQALSVGGSCFCTGRVRVGGIMAIKMKDIGSQAQKFSSRAQASVPDYKLGIQNPKHDQMASAIAAAPVWAQAVADAAARNAFGTGLQKAGPNKWSANALNLGAQRYPQGIAQAMPSWQSGFQPYYTVISNLTLPPRGLRRSAQNLQRVAAVDAALAAAKTGKAA